ncbi:polyphosphate:AMP phosphotransferase [Slackia heliotrinireducens]|uniref:Uncharacterized conserved protein n=1 Tax=Slackia heliotrinireducens (strain ATCC 29202 / DSM 20476 / NCTC 11029 / RHS 1) TaxID=471855 RepID=C7N1F1_SLAHD|nr:polyphosphate--AMP phosphotransferase [Slackia heliotrinireducens]ACV21243.1 uncharacterized conserved protein [Slackia heliotrinireducens DSM 20476]VEG98677.1 polyphosphate:AMP phosphotransferase [Slackia heliotrinireducens]
MIEQVDLTRALSKEEYKAPYDDLIAKLIVLQQRAKQENIGVVILMDGWQGSGRGSRIGDLLYNLDARLTNVHVLSDLDKREVEYFDSLGSGVTGYKPIMQEFWEDLGMRGTMTIYEQGWYAAARRRLGSVPVDQRPAAVLETVGEFERQLADNGYVVIKFFVHVSEKSKNKRIKQLLSDPNTAWRVKDDKGIGEEDYDEAYKVFDQILSKSDYDYAHWVLVNGEDKRDANLTIAKTLVVELEKALNKEVDPAAKAAAQKAADNSAGKLVNDIDPRKRTEEEAAIVLAAATEIANEQATHAPRYSRFVMEKKPPRVELIDNTLSLTREEYKEQLKAEQKRLGELQLQAYRARIPLMLVYEGDDAAGKGGSIKRVCQSIDARSYTIFPSAAPTKPELLHPHLWRYWTRLPKAGHVGIYDRSWYGRVLVERVEGFASPEEWAHAYDEINDFEHALGEWGAVLLKFWVAVDPDEQLARFEAREQNPDKQWKITPEDWRNRDKAPQYKAAVNDMFRLTSSNYAPWNVIESTDKLYARVKVLKTINAALDKRLNS